jgi:hypothetical protein
MIQAAMILNGQGRGGPSRAAMMVKGQSRGPTIRDAGGTLPTPIRCLRWKARCRAAAPARLRSRCRWL